MRKTVLFAATAEPGGETWACRFFFPSATGNQCLGFIYENGEMTRIPTWPGGTNGFATGVNNRGQVVGWAENGVEDPTCNDPVELQFRGFILDTRTDEMTELTPLPGDDFGFQAWYWNQHDGIVSIGTLDGRPRNQALGMNNRGQGRATTVCHTGTTLLPSRLRRPKTAIRSTDFDGS